MSVSKTMRVTYAAEKSGKNIQIVHYDKSNKDRTFDGAVQADEAVNIRVNGTTYNRKHPDFQKIIKRFNLPGFWYQTVELNRWWSRNIVGRYKYSITTQTKNAKALGLKLVKEGASYYLSVPYYNKNKKIPVANRNGSSVIRPHGMIKDGRYYLVATNVNDLYKIIGSNMQWSRKLSRDPVFTAGKIYTVQLSLRDKKFRGLSVYLLPIVPFLPQRVRNMISKQHFDIGPNCFGAVMYAMGYAKTPRWSGKDETVLWAQREGCHTIGNRDQKRVGDIGIIHGGEVYTHAFVFIGGDLVFTKNGGESDAPYSIYSERDTIEIWHKMLAEGMRKTMNQIKSTYKTKYYRCSPYLFDPHKPTVVMDSHYYNILNFVTDVEEDLYRYQFSVSSSAKGKKDRFDQLKWRKLRFRKVYPKKQKHLVRLYKYLWDKRIPSEKYKARRFYLQALQVRTYGLAKSISYLFTYSRLLRSGFVVE
ncbi:MAG: hypothetical protein ABIE74_04705 [Pseudomonadota bacterium]